MESSLARISGIHKYARVYPNWLERLRKKLRTYDHSKVDYYKSEPNNNEAKELVLDF